MLNPKELFMALLGIPNDVPIFVHEKRFTKADKHLNGYCYEFEGEYTIVIEKAVVSDPDPLYWIEILAHELTHISQYVSGKMVDGPRTIVYWEGQAIDESKMDYWQLPWEIEAFAMQEQLTLDYLAYMKRHN